YTGLSGLETTATRDARGTTSLRSCSSLPTGSSDRNVEPVTLAPGRARPSTSPTPTASPTPTNTMGMLLVARLAASAAGVLQAERMTSTLLCASSAASAGSRSYLPSAQRYSKARLAPSVWPSSRSVSRKTRNDGAGPSDCENGESTPMRATFRPWAAAARGAPSPPTIVRATNERRLLTRRRSRLGRLARDRRDGVGEVHLAVVLGVVADLRLGGGQGAG